MKTRIILILTSAITMFLGLTKAHSAEKSTQGNIKLIGVLKDKKGKELGKVYIKDFKGDVFRKLLITKEKDGKTDTLYFINDCIFKNPKGVDITFAEKNFHGYKIEWIKGDSLQLFAIGTAASGASDPAIIEWNYKKEIFEVFKSP